MQVRKHAMKNWAAYSAPQPHTEPMRGHLMLYPLRVHRSGHVAALPGSEVLPDAPGAFILPKKVAAVLPSTLVT